jgi:LysR family cyn operon transcriptional activator
MNRNPMIARSIRYLLAVAKHQSFTRAAEALYVSQPTLSQQIKQLEEVLDVQLLDRSGRSVRLTAAGEIYARYAKRALGELDAAQRAVNELNDLSRGSIRLGMTPITEYLSAPLLNEFNSLHPGIAVNSMEMTQEDIERSVAEDRIDLGIAFTNVLTTKAHSNDIDSHILFVETLNLAIGKSHELASKKETLDEQGLESVPLIMLNTDFALRRHFDVYCIEHGITPNIVMETNSLSIIIQTVRLGRLATILPESISCSHADLAPVRLTPELPYHTTTMFCRKGAHKSPACEAFAELMSSWFNNRCTKSADKEIRVGKMAKPAQDSSAKALSSMKS